MNIKNDYGKKIMKIKITESGVLIDGSNVLETNKKLIVLKDLLEKERTKINQKYAKKIKDTIVDELKLNYDDVSAISYIPYINIEVDSQEEFDKVVDLVANNSDECEYKKRICYDIKIKINKKVYLDELNSALSKTRVFDLYNYKLFSSNSTNKSSRTIAILSLELCVNYDYPEYI